jgi:hypothetical protein
MDKQWMVVAAMYLSLHYPYDWGYGNKVVSKYIMGLYSNEDLGLESLVWC